MSRLQQRVHAALVLLAIAGVVVALVGGWGLERQFNSLAAHEAREFQAMRDAMLVADRAMRGQILAEGLLNQRPDPCIR